MQNLNKEHETVEKFHNISYATFVGSVAERLTVEHVNRDYDD